jgi:hypothetical protein
MKVDAGRKLQAAVNRLTAQASAIAAALAALTASVADGSWFQVNAFSGSGWSAFSGGAKPAVKLVGRPRNAVLFAGTMSVGTTTSGQQILNTLPSAYWPANTPVRVTVGAFGGTAAINNSSYIVVNTDGTVTVGTVNGSPTSVGWSTIYPLDSPVAP